MPQTEEEHLENRNLDEEEQEKVHNDAEVSTKKVVKSSTFFFPLTFVNLNPNFFMLAFTFKKKTLKASFARSSLKKLTSKALSSPSKTKVQTS